MRISVILSVYPMPQQHKTNVVLEQSKKTVKNKDNNTVMGESSKECDTDTAKERSINVIEMYEIEVSESSDGGWRTTQNSV